MSKSRTKPVRRWWIGVAVVVVIAMAGVIAVASTSKSGTADHTASPELMSKVTSVPTRVFEQVGTGSSASAPKPISAPALTAGGKPLILYIGAEYCPYCATERWPMVIALSRFGSFSGLGTTHSSSADVFPDTQTFSFHGARYTSRWISFTGVELQTNERHGDGYAPLDRLTAEQQRLLDTYDRAPYVGSGDSSGGIPFIDFGGKFVVGGASYDPSVLQGKSATQIADALADPSSNVSRGAIGVANAFTSTICSLTGGQPKNVCADAG
jgi:hypothetical protein